MRAAGFSIVPKGESEGREVESVDDASIDLNAEWTEGRLKLSQHYKRERGRGLSKAKKAAFKREHGHLICESCGGKRFKEEVLEVKCNDKSIYDVLVMSVDEAIDFFSSSDGANIAKAIQPLSDVGLGYVKLGQSSNTLSGGEAQRVKLASFLGKARANNKILFIFDEPTTGLHFHDIKKLLTSFNALIEQGHSIIVIEHNTDVIRSADWVIDLGPEAGDDGGQLVFAGIPQKLKKEKRGHTSKFL